MTQEQVKEKYLIISAALKNINESLNSIYKAIELTDWEESTNSAFKAIDFWIGGTSDQKNDLDPEWTFYDVKLELEDILANKKPLPSSYDEDEEELEAFKSKNFLKNIKENWIPEGLK
jgi:hypothetical protein